VIVILALSVAAAVILTGEDLGTVAALREMNHTTSIGWVLALWGLGSAIGGIVYGALNRHPPAALLLVLLAASTAAVSFADGRWTFAALLFVSGLFCAPTITATVDELTRTVPARVRGEAMGWHGSALTLGGAAGAPVVGWAIDNGGWEGGFELAGMLGLVIAVVGLATHALHRRGLAPAEGTQSGGDVEPTTHAEASTELTPGQ
jgi:sugar phosphate permease